MNPHFLVALGISWAISLGLAGYLGWDYGASGVEAKWQKREADSAAAQAARIEAAQERARAAERGAVARMDEVSRRYQAQLKEAGDANEVLRRAVRDGSRRLSIPAICAPSGGGVVPDSTTAAGGRDGETRAELRGPAADFLVALAAEADAVTRQLGACQDALRPR